ncbi:glutathione S-transferase [Nitzschia inconspicua]|uniref:Glutathione S-transferase n=1 Tax=Nitzschia inconspicua TaxID=303405 RepID=A0A9K3KTF1_9STRA|nr:glutathione S-transferase [Nitzschia inconspicua]
MNVSAEKGKEIKSQRAKELEELRSKGVAKTRREKLKNFSSPLQTAEEARQFLIACHDQSKKKAWNHAPPSALEGGVDSWFMMQRYRHQEMRKRRQEAEQLLHGFRGYYDESLGWSPRKERRHRSSFGLGYGMDDSLADPDVLERRQTTMPRLQHEWDGNGDKDNRQSQRLQPNPLDPNRTEFLHDTRHYDGTRYPRTSQEMEVSNGVRLFSDEMGGSIEQRRPGNTTYKGRFINSDGNSEEYDCRIDTSGSEERLRNIYSGQSLRPQQSDGIRAALHFQQQQTSEDVRDGPPSEHFSEPELVPETVWRDFISDEPGARFPPEAGRYHLYASYACPGSHRALIVRALKGLEGIVSVTIVHPTWRHTRKDDPEDKHRGWIFGDPNGKPFHNTMGRGGPFPPAYPGNDPDPVMNAYSVRELYEHADDTSGKYTVPLLWDKKLNTIVNNESSDISYMLNSCLNDFAKNPKLDLYTENDEDGLDRLNEVSQWLYPMMIHGVYRCGFARTQAAYDRAIDELTEAFDAAAELLKHQRYLTGDVLTDADIRLFVTLLRFDEVYAFYFRANTRLVMMTPSLLNFCREIYQMPGVAETCHMDQIKAHFFGSHAEWNKYSVVPRGLGFMKQLEVLHDRDTIEEYGHI